jgi:hypothetical protein
MNLNELIEFMEYERQKRQAVRRLRGAGQTAKRDMRPRVQARSRDRKNPNRPANR